MSVRFSEEELAKLLARQPDISVYGEADTQPRTPANEAYGRLTRKQIDVTSMLLEQLVEAGLPTPELEYRFHPVRKWRMDLAWPAHKVALEIEGGIWLRTRRGHGKGHAHPVRFLQDCEKYNEAVIMGWNLIRVTPKMIKDGKAIDTLSRLFVSCEAAVNVH